MRRLYGFWHYTRSIARPLGDRFFVDVEVLSHQFRWRMRKPVGKRDFLVAGSTKHPDELKIGISGVFDIMSEVAFDITNVASGEIHSERVRAGVEYRHAPLALDIVLPLVRIRVPVHLAHSARSNSNEGRGYRGRDLEICAVGDLDGSGIGRSGGPRGLKRENKWMGRSRRVLLNCRAVRRQVTWNRTLEDPEIVKRNFCKRFGRDAEILGEHRRRCVSKPIGNEQRVEFVGMTVVKTDDEFAAVWPKALQGMRSAGRKIPEIAGFHVANKGSPLSIEDSHTAVAVRHDRPLGGLMPVQLADSAGSQSHIDA